MRSPLFPIAVVVSLLSVPGLAADAPFVSKNGGYQVLFPAAPKEQVNVVDGIKMHIAVAASKDRTASFAVTWGDHFPEARKAADRVIDGELTSLLNAHRRLVAQGPVKLHDWTVRGYQLVRSDGRAYHGRIFLKGARVYHLMVLAEKENAARLSEAFFSSFKLIGDGVEEPPQAPPRSLVALAEAGVQVVLNGEPKREDLPQGQGTMISTRTKGGLRTEILMFTPMKVAPAAREEALNRLVKGFRESTETVADLRSLKVDDRPAREFRTRRGNTEAFVRLVMFEGGALTLQLVGPRGVHTKKDAEEFFANVKGEPIAGATPR